MLSKHLTTEKPVFVRIYKIGIQPQKKKRKKIDSLYTFSSVSLLLADRIRKPMHTVPKNQTFAKNLNPNGVTLVFALNWCACLPSLLRYIGTIGSSLQCYSTLARIRVQCTTKPRPKQPNVHLIDSSRYTVRSMFLLNYSAGISLLVVILHRCCRQLQPWYLLWLFDDGKFIDNSVYRSIAFDRGVRIRRYINWKSLWVMAK